MRFAQLPTPLDPMERLQSALGDLTLLLKREEMTGLALGGSAVRMLELAFGQADAEGASRIVAPGGADAALPRQTAAAARLLRMECCLILPRAGAPDPNWSEVLLGDILGARIIWIEEGDTPARALEAECRSGDFCLAGERRAALEAAAGMDLALELQSQIADAGSPPVIWAAMPQPYLDGMEPVLRLSGAGWRLYGTAPPGEAPRAGALPSLARLLGLPLSVPEDGGALRCAPSGTDRQVRAAIDMAARTEGVLLDPAEGGRALALGIDQLRTGALPPGSRAVILNSGGPPDLTGPGALLQTA